MSVVYGSTHRKAHFETVGDRVEVVLDAADMTVEVDARTVANLVVGGYMVLEELVEVLEDDEAASEFLEVRAFMRGRRSL